MAQSYCAQEVHVLCFHHPRSRDHRERMMYMMDWIKWKVIELLVRHNVLAVVPVRANQRRRYR